MGGTQDNGTICWAADGTVSHCRDGDGGYAVIDDNAQDTFNVLMYHTFFNQTNSQIGFERASNTLANADGQLSGWTFRGCSGTTSNNGFRCADNVLFYAPMNQGPGSPVNTLYFGTDRLYRSTNRGDTMTLVSQGPLVPSTPAGSGVVVTVYRHLAARRQCKTRGLAQRASLCNYHRLLRHDRRHRRQLPSAKPGRPDQKLDWRNSHRSQQQVYGVHKLHQLLTACRSTDL